MDLGLYKMKYPARRVMMWLLPTLKNVSPNTISWCILPVGIATAICYYYADALPYLLLAGPALIILRMILATLNGLVAVTFNRSSPAGEIINRIPAEISDALLLVAIALSSPARTIPGIAAIAVAWLITFAGLVGLTAGRPIQSVGPAGQTDRLAALLALSLAGYFAPMLHHPFDALLWFLYYTIAAGALTILLRLKRALQK